MTKTNIMVLKNSPKTPSYPTKLPQPLQRKKKHEENFLPNVSLDITNQIISDMRTLWGQALLHPLTWAYICSTSPFSKCPVNRAHGLTLETLTPVGCFLELSYASVVRNKIVMRQESEKKWRSSGLGYTQEHIMQVLFFQCSFWADTKIGVLMG